VRNLKLRLLLACAAILMLLPLGCRKPKSAGGPATPAVTVARPMQEPVTDYLDMTGTVAPSKTVNLVARVAGYLESVNFADGATVQKGQLLFVIEQAPYEEQVDLNQAVYNRAQAELERQQEMMKENATAETTVESWVSQRDQAKAQLELAKINLGYTRITAPFTGRIGARQVDPGNLVGSTGPTVLATLDQLQPIYVNFSLNERDALRLRDALRERGEEVGSRIGKTPVEVGLQNEKGYPHTGLLDFADNTLSTSTGTIALRAIFKNEGLPLYPGLFARVRIPLGGPKPMLVVPGSAIGSDQQGDYVYVVGADDVVARRAIVKGPRTSNGTAIRSGLEPDDRVVVEGLLNARAGEKVAPTARAAPTAAAAPTTPTRPPPAAPKR
jgi:RND family efflux transporter MFP subunit